MKLNYREELNLSNEIKKKSYKEEYKKKLTH